jgi:cupin domain protein
MSKLIKNFPIEEVTNLAGVVDIQEGQIVSKTLAQNKYVSMTLFAFDKDEEISTHDSDGDAMVNVLEGKGKFIIDGKEYIVSAGESIIMPAKKPHSVYAVEQFKMMLVVVFPS